MPNSASEWKLIWFFLLIIVNVMLTVWEIFQFKAMLVEYFKSFLNIIDSIRIIITGIWIMLELSSINYLKLSWIVAFIKLLRGITAFRLFDGTRYYIKLITAALTDIKYFLIIFVCSTFTFGLLFTISRRKTVDFSSIWSDPYGLNFGDFVDPDDNVDFTMDYIVFIGATLFIVVLMLNLLISILGDSY